eukprot:tig00000711_g3402.t1
MGRGVVLFAVLAALACAVSAVRTIDAYRMVQYDRAGTPLGSRRTGLNFLASSTQAADLARKVALVPFDEVSSGVIENLVAAKQASGVLVLLPPKLDAIPAETISKWKAVEQELVNQEFSVPIYFAFEDEGLRAMYNEVKGLTVSGKTAGAASSEGFQFLVSDSEAKRINNVVLTNVQGLLEGAAGVSSSGEALPIIAVVAHYDSFAAAPELASGTDSNGSGVAALLELARIFSKLYAGSRTQGKYNLLFILTGGGRLNFAGSKHWLASVDPRISERVEFALCLDSIAQPGPVHLHVSKPARDADVAKLYEAFTSAGEQLGVEVNIVHKKVNVSTPEVAWEHEHFSKKRILAGTLSSSSAPAPMLARCSILDRRELVDTAALARNVRLVAEALGKHIYGLLGRNVEVFAGSLAPNAEFLGAWLDTLSATPRAAPFLPRAGTLLPAVEKLLAEYVTEVSRASFPVDTDLTFYDKTSVQVTAYRVKPITFHLLTLGAVLVWLFALHAAILFYVEGPAGLQQITKIFARKPAKGDKKKAS